METAKIETLRNHTTGEAVAPRTAMEAVTGLTEALDNLGNQEIDTATVEKIWNEWEATE